MSETKPLTLRELRELARKHLGRGHSRLKTKDELLDALRKAAPEAVGPAQKMVVPAPPQAKVENPSEEAPAIIAKAIHPIRPPEPPRTVEPPKAAEPAVAAKPPAPPPAPVAAPQPKLSRPAESVVTEGFFARGQTPPRHTTPATEEPLVEGFFVARIAGLREARRHRLAGLTRKAPHHVEEDLGELPASYPDETAVLLARDPTTVFFFWDFTPAARRIPGGAVHVLLRVYEGGRQVREQEFPLDAKSFYVQGLTPGHTYRVEAFVRLSDGRVSPLRISTNPVTLPPNTPSGELTVRMMRVPWAAPLARHAGASAPGAGQHLELEGGRPQGSSLSWRGGVPPMPGELPPHLEEGVSGEDLPSSLSWAERRVWPETVPTPPGLPPHLAVSRDALPSSFTWAARPEEVPAPLDLPAHLELPSSHTFRGGAGEELPSSPRRKKS
jgi:hypothetical protein